MEHVSLGVRVGFKPDGSSLGKDDFGKMIDHFICNLGETDVEGSFLMNKGELLVVEVELPL